MRKIVFAMALALGVIISSAASYAKPAKASKLSDHIVRSYQTPTRIVFTEGDITNAEALLKNSSGQACLGSVPTMTMKGASSIILDFGRELHGGIRVVTAQFPDQKAPRVRIRFGESVSETCSDAGGEGGATNDHAVRDFEDSLPWLGVREFGNSGFRFVRIDLLETDRTLAITEINAIHVDSDYEQIGSFKCSDDRLNDIWETGRHTVKLNMQEYIWDGIKRDRLVWIGDLYPEVMTVANVYGNAEVIPASLDYAVSITPLPQWFSGMCSYSLWWVLIQDRWYEYTGDLAFLKSNAGYLSGLLRQIASFVGEDGHSNLPGGFLDWPSKADDEAVNTGMHALMMLTMQKGEYLCGIIGDQTGADICRECYSRLSAAAPAIRDSFLKTKIDPDQYGRKQAVALMSLAGMIEPEAAAERLLFNDCHGFSTFYGYYMLEALAQAGKYAEAMDIISDFWGAMLDLGATSFWEDFDINWKENASRIDEMPVEGKVDVHKSYGGYCYVGYRHSLCHGWASGPTAWLSRYVLGLQPAQAGQGNVSVDPHLGNLDWAEGTYPTPQGKISIRVSKMDDGKTLARVDAPAGVTLIPGENVVLERYGIDVAFNGIEAIETGFKSIPDSVQTAVYWYWLSDHISKDGVIKDLEAMKKAGINRAFIGNQSIGEPYGPVKLFSEEWWDITHAALKKATELGIEIGIFNCPGWSQSGGPWIDEDKSMRYVEFGNSLVYGNGSVQEFDLPEVPANRLVSVFAYPAAAGKSETFTAPATKSIAMHVAEPMTVRSLSVTPDKAVQFPTMRFSWTENGKKKSVDFKFDRSNPGTNVGFKALPPVVIDVPDAVGTDFTLELPRDADVKLTIVLSELAKVERYAEKSLAKMFQTPLPMWDEYMWSTPAETESAEGYIKLADIVNLKDQLVSDNGVIKSVRWNVPSGEWNLVFAYMKTTGQTNSPAAPEGTGLEVDKINSSHIAYHFDSFLGEIQRRIPAEDRKTWTVCVEDSYETGSQNWTDGFAQSFADTYGYDPLPYLPALQGNVVGSKDITERFLWDLRRLVADKVAYEYVGGLREVCHEHGLQTWLENYGHWGFPSEFLMYGGQSDQIGGEFWSEGDLGSIENKAASSCGHIYGKNKIWAESCTAGSPAFMRYPRLMKQRTDLFFTQGINSTLLHVYVQQPDDDKPGMAAWFGNEFNRNNAWFSHLDLFTQYLKRCNHMLQQGRYIADVAYFIGEDAPKMTGVQDPALPKGYSFDYINGEILRSHAHVEDGCLVLDSGMKYRVLVLPRQNTMRPEILESIAGFVREGLTILGPAPEHSPSLQDWPAADVRVKSLASEVWNSTHRYGKGRVYADGTSLETVFAELGVKPDFSYAPVDKDGYSAAPEILFIHRGLSQEGDIYFVSNQQDQKSAFTASFRVADGLVPEIWDPVTGNSSAVQFKRQDGACVIAMDMDCLQSAFVVFRKPVGAATATDIALTDKYTISSPWKVEFAPEIGNEGFTVTMDTLHDWTADSDERVKYFSGAATYSNAFVLTRSDFSRLEKAVVNLGNVMVMAKVWVNGEYAGGAWTAPYSLDVTGLLKTGSNTIRVEVVNNWRNRLIQEMGMPASERKTKCNIEFYKADTELQSSGLLGPVTIELYK